MAPDARSGRQRVSTPAPGSTVWLQRYRTEMAASASSVLSTAAAYPLDSIKTRMQTYPYGGFLDCVKQTYHAEQIKGFFRGAAAPMVSVTLVRTVSFSIYRRSKLAYANWIKKNLEVDVLAHVHANGTYPNLYTISCFGLAGATAGSAISAIACPFELTKLSAQISVLLADRKSAATDGKSLDVAASYQNKGTLKTMANIVHHRGFMGLYTGFRLHILRDTLGTAIYFGVYESGRQLAKTIAGDHPHTGKFAVVMAGGLCGIVSWALIYPIDSAKSIYQKNSLIYHKGQKAEKAPKIAFFRRNMYRGLSVSLARSCAVNALFFSTFEFIKNQIRGMDD